MEGVDAAPQWQVRWWKPFGSAVPVFSGPPATGFDHPVMRPACEGQQVDVGQTAVRPLVDVVDLAQVTGNIASRCTASTLLGMQDDPLISIRDALASPEV